VRVAVAGFDLARRKVDVEDAHELVLQRHSMRVGGHAHGIERVVRRLGEDETTGQDGGGTTAASSRFFLMESPEGASTSMSPNCMRWWHPC
jgi:hypothetical protein